MIDYLAYIGVKFISSVLMLLPVEISLSLGEKVGAIFYYLDLKRRNTVYKNLRIAFSGRYGLEELRSIAKGVYKNYGQSIIETLIVPKMDKDYLRRYINIEGLNYIEESIKKGKGVILLSFHFGSWEVSHVSCSLLGYPFKILVKPQRRFKRLANFLELRRQDKGCLPIPIGMSTREIIKSLKNNEMIGMVADQSGRDGVLIPFLGRSASLPTGAIRFALKLGVPIIPAIIIRTKGPYHRIVLERPIYIEPKVSYGSDIYNNLFKVKSILEKYIKIYPQQYCWYYKVWKYSPERLVVMLSDNKTGHLRQMQAVLDIFKHSSYNIKTEIIDVEFKNKFAKILLNLLVSVTNTKYATGDFRYLKWFIKKDAHQRITSSYADVIISCGWALSAANLLLARENDARSVVIMRPAVSTKRFDLAIIPKHDKPAKRPNVVITEGALNSIDEQYLERHSRVIHSKIETQEGRLKIGFLIGGDTKGFSLKKEPIQELINQIKSVSEQLDAELLITTSRRTPEDIQELIKTEFKDYSLTKLLVIANEQNIPEAVGGILGISKILIVSPDSISMISEAASAGRYVIVFDIRDGKGRLPRKHKSFLKEITREGYISFVDYSQVKDTLMNIWQKKPPIKILKDRELIKEPLLKLF